MFDTGESREVPTEVLARPTETVDVDAILFLRAAPARTLKDWSVRPVEHLHGVATEFESCAEAEAVYDLTVSAATDILDFDVSTVSIAEGGSLVTKASTSSTPADFYDVIPDDHGLAGRTYRSGESARVDDIQALEEGDPARSRYRSVISVPVGSVGVFQAGATEVGAFTGRDLELAELLAGHAADALERIRSVDALRTSRRKITRLHDVADEMVTAGTESRVFELAADAAEDILNFDQCTFLRADGEAFVSTATSTGLDMPDRALGTDEGVAGRVLASRESELVHDVAITNDAKPVFEEITSGITVPIGDIGVFQAFSRDPCAFTERDVELAELLTAHVATCVERARSAHALERQRAQFSSLVANLPGMVFRTAADDVGPLAFVNDYASELTGYDPAALTDAGTTFDELVHPRERERIVRKRREALADGTSYEATYRLLTADSGERWVRERATGQFTDEEGSAILEGFLTDVTGNRRRAQLEVMNRFLRHNLRNDVQVIHGHAENIERGLDDDDRLLDSVTRIRSAAAKLIGHSEKASTLEGLLGSEGEVGRTTLDLAAIVRRRADAVERRDGVTVTTSIPDPCRAAGVPVFGAALTEALENAARHGGDSSVEIAVAVDDDYDGAHGDVLLTIRDDGPGIPEQDRVAIERQSETALTHSSGLGLWLIQWIVTASRGTLDIHDPPDGGTEIRISLHAAEGEGN